MKMADEQIGKLIAQKYRVDELIKRSPGGDLYRATHVLMEKPVSIRLLPRGLAENKDKVAAFFNEAKAAARLGHPNILNVIDFGTDANGQAYTVFDASKGETLRSRILRDIQLPPAEAVELAKQAAAALSAAHSSGVIHGNLSPENIILSEIADGAVIAKVSEFGSPNAMMRGDDELSSPADLAYLSPEQCSGSDEPDARSDIYSLAAVLYEMLSGVVPFTGNKPTDVMLKHIEEAPAPLIAFRSDLPPEIESVMLRALSKDPAARQQTADELITELERPVSAGVLAAAESSGKTGELWKTAAMVLVGIGLLAAALIYATSVKQTDPETVLMPDADGLPVQPINPATGIEEQQLAAMPGLMTEGLGNTALGVPETLPGGDGYNPWASGAPPPGAPPQSIPPGGQVITIDPNTGSQFMPPDGVILVPVPVNTNANARPSPSPGRTPAANSNTSATPIATPAATPAASPRPTQPRATPSPERQATPRTGNRTDGDERDNS